MTQTFDYKEFMKRNYILWLRQALKEKWFGDDFLIKMYFNQLIDAIEERLEDLNETTN